MKKKPKKHKNRTIELTQREEHLIVCCLKDELKRGFPLKTVECGHSYDSDDEIRKLISTLIDRKFGTIDPQ